MGEMGLMPLPSMWGTVIPNTGGREWLTEDTMEWFLGEVSEPRLERERVRRVVVPVLVWDKQGGVWGWPGVIAKLARTFVIFICFARFLRA